MAESNTGSNGPQKGKWKKVVGSYKPQGGGRRGAPSVITTELGATESNTGATEIMDTTAIARGIDPTKEYKVDLFVDEERKTIIVHATADATDGTTAIRRYKKKVTFHLGAVFIAHPTLRPQSKKVKVLVSQELDENGLPVMTIPIMAGTTKFTQSRGQSPGSQAAAGDDE